MTTGISIHIGLNRVDPTHYQGWNGQLKGCENDARMIEAIAHKQKFTTTLLLNEQATADQVKAAISAAAQQLKSGDILLISYSGHGGQVPDPTIEEPDHLDETWVLYDRQLLDDELYALWSQFEPDVRILLFSDSCHSGSVAREFRDRALFAGQPAANIPVPRALPTDVRDQTYAANKQLYDQLEASNPQGHHVDIDANVILISGCEDDQVSLDGPQNGIFTGALLKTWNKGKFKSSLPKFHKSILNKIEFYQHPSYFKVGHANPVFEGQRPFTI